MFEKVDNILKNNGIIAFVTDTVWGIGCLPTSEIAVKRIYEIKKRDGNKPLILMSNEIYNILKYVKQPLNKETQKLIKKHFPGALTLVVDKSKTCPNYITSSMSTVGIRIPNNSTFSKICENIEGHVLATTSANLSGEQPALSYEEALKYIGDKVDLVIEDFGQTAKGLASTVAGFDNEKIIIYRKGEIIL